MRFLILLLLLVLLVLPAAAQLNIPATAYTGKFMTNRTAAEARAYLGVSSGVPSGTSMTNVNIYTQTNSGNILFGTDNTYSVGLEASARPSHVFAGQTVRAIDFYATSAGHLYFNNRLALASPADGVALLQNWNANDFNRLQFGGTSASFPALKRSGTELQVRLADDSGYGNFALRTLSTPSGANSRAGNATMVAGTVDVAVNTVTANSIVMLTRKTAGGTLGMAITYTLNAGTGFTINSDNILDTSTFSYFVIENP